MINLFLFSLFAMNPMAAIDMNPMAAIDMNPMAAIEMAAIDMNEEKLRSESMASESVTMNKGDCLEGASCAVFIPMEAIAALEGWHKSSEVCQEVCIGFTTGIPGCCHQMQDSGTVCVGYYPQASHPHPHFWGGGAHLNDIAFEDVEDLSDSKELIAERDAIDRPSAKPLKVRPE